VITYLEVADDDDDDDDSDDDFRKVSFSLNYRCSDNGLMFVLWKVDIKKKIGSSCGHTFLLEF
jgi:hypothetical protein